MKNGVSTKAEHTHSLSSNNSSPRKYIYSQKDKDKNFHSNTIFDYQNYLITLLWMEKRNVLWHHHIYFLIRVTFTGNILSLTFKAQNKELEVISVGTHIE